LRIQTTACLWRFYGTCGLTNYRNVPARDTACGRSVVIEGQLQDIAAEIGMSREALYRALAALEAEGSVTRGIGDKAQEI
jgi:hypothetical protein